MAGSTLFEHIRHLLWTTGPAAVLAGILYLVLGRTQHADGRPSNARRPSRTCWNRPSTSTCCFCCRPPWCSWARS
ncbi:hypothetical protein ACFQV4_27935 [Streptomyces thermocarboxydus]